MDAREKINTNALRNIVSALIGMIDLEKYPRVKESETSLTDALDRLDELEGVVELVASTLGLSKDQLIEAYRLNRKLKEFDATKAVSECAK